MNKVNRPSICTVIAGVMMMVSRLSGYGAEAAFITNQITASPKEAVTLILEAEAFDDLKVFPDFHRQPGQGWYAKEHTHASGRAFVCVDSESEGAAMMKRFPRAYPAGKYVVGVRAVLTRWQKGVECAYGRPSGNAIRVELGLLRDGKFTPAAAVPLKLFYGSGYGFAPLVVEAKSDAQAPVAGKPAKPPAVAFADPIVEVASEWNAVRVTAVTIVSGGIGDVPEFGLPYIGLDQVKISNVPGYCWSTSHSGRINLVTAQEIAEKERAAAKAKPESAAPAAKDKAPDKQPPAAQGNFVADGSFEAGGRPWWTPALLDASSFTFDPQDLIEGNCPHGKRFARIVPCPNGPQADEKAASRPLTAHIRSRAFSLAEGDYTAGCFARANRLGTKLTIKIGPSGNLFVKDFDLTADWKAYAFDFKNGKAEETVVICSVAGTNPDLQVDVDAVQVLATGQAGSGGYREAEGANLLLACPAPYGTCHDDEPLRFIAVLCNDTEAAKTFTADWRIRDIIGNTFATGIVAVTGSKGVTKKDFTVDFKGYGNFVLGYTLREKLGQLVLVPFARVQNPARLEAGTKRPCYLGVLGRDIREQSGRMLRHYGIEFKTDLSDTILRAPQNTYGYHQHYTYRNEIEQMHKSGLKWVPWIYNGEPAPYDKVVYASGPAAHGGRPWMSATEGAWYIADTLKRYQGLYHDMILVTDEFSNQRVPRDGLEYLPAAYKAVKSAAPNLAVMNSVEFLAAEALAKALGGVKGIWADWLGGSRYGSDKWWYAREQKFIEQAGVPFYVDAVGWGPNSADLEYFDPQGRPQSAAKIFSRLNNVAWDLAQEAAIYRPERFSCYTTKYGNTAHDPYNQISPFDGRLNPVAAQWLTVLQFLREAERGGILLPKHASNIEACHFRISGTNWVALYAQAPALWKEIELTIPDSQLTILDHHLLARPKLVLKRGELLLIGSTNPGLNEAVCNMKAKDLLLERHAVIAQPGGGVKCVALLRNNTAQRQQGRLTMHENMLAQSAPKEFPVELTPGAQQLYTVEQQAGAFAGRPVTYYPVNATLQLNGFLVPEQVGVRQEELQEKEGMGMRAGAYYWMHYGVPLAAGGSGKKPLDVAWLDQWQKTQSPASVYINWGLNGSYQRAQVRWGGENSDPAMTLEGYMPSDFMSLHFVRYDDAALYLGALIEDRPAFSGAADAREWGESVTYAVLPDLEKRLSEHEPKEVCRIRIVQTSADQVAATLIKPDGAEVAVEGVCAASGDTRRYLVRVPFTALGFSVKAGDTLGFDITCRDSDDPSGKTEAEYDWSGASYAPDDAFGFGQLLIQ